jgi:hypothetical protein
MARERVRQILHDQLNMRKVCAKMVPKNLTQVHKDNRKNIYSDIMERITEQLEVLKMSSYVMKLGFFNTIRKRRGNRCIERHPLHREWKKQEWANGMWWQWWSFSSTSEA